MNNIIDRNLIRYIVIICFVPNLIVGQFNNFKFEKLDATEGLSSSTCIEVFQDKEGFMWFGTNDGLNKYNGYEFEIYKTDLDDEYSISSNRINAIEEDDAGNLWVATNNGLNFFNKKTNKFSLINLYHQSSSFSNSQKIINDLLYDSIKNTLWVATKNGLIKIELNETLDLNKLNFSYYRNDQSNLNTLDNNRVQVILKDESNTIWVSTDGQHLNRYNEDKDNFERIFIDAKNSYELNHIPKIAFIDSDGDFWIGNDLSNLILWDKKNNNFKHISLVESSTSILDLYQDRKGMFWVSTNVDGLYLFTKNKEEYVVEEHLVNDFSNPSSLPNNKLTKIFEDKNGHYWIGSHDKGVSKLDITNDSFGHYFYQPNKSNGLSEKSIQSVLQDSKQRIWVGAYNGGLNLFNEKQKTFEHFRHDSKNSNSLSSNRIQYTFESHDGNIWVCTLDGGLNKFNPEAKTFETFMHNVEDSLSIGQNSVWTGVEDFQHRLWLGLRTEGLSLYNPKTNHFHNYKNTNNNKNSIISNSIISIHTDSKNRLLIGTTLGLNVVDLNKLDEFIPNEIEFIHIKGKGIEGNNINYITEDHLGNIWLGADRGVFKLDADLNLIRSYTSKNGLPNDLVVGIKEDDNYNFWITTKGGLSVLNPETHQFKNFNVHDGLQGLSFQSKSIAKTKDGRIIVGGINGFNIFQPNDIITAEPVTLNPQITNFRLNNKAVVAGDSINGRLLLSKAISDTKELTLRYNENYISFEFVALYFENPEQVEYAYRMSGLDEEFINIRYNRMVNHSNLQPGDYIFEIKASADGQWENSKTAFINIKILPPLWKTWWAYIVYLIIGTLLFWFIVRYYTLKVQEKQQHELDQMKLEFFVNVSHEFRTPLTLILSPVDKILSNLSFQNKFEGITESVISIQQSARRLMHLVNQLLDYRKMDVGMLPLQLEKGDIMKSIRDIFSLFNDLAKKKNIKYTFKTTSNSIISFFDRDKLEKIITNLISNAIKFTNNGGEITVTINKIKEKKIKSKFLLFKKQVFENYVEIIVEDSGIGLDKKQLRSIFSRFYNVDVNKSGTGIGLNFTKGLVELHGGEIYVESEQEKGSKFVVRLPLILKAKVEVIENVKNEFLINSMKAVEYDMLISNDTLSKQKEILTSNDSNVKLPIILVVEDNKELRTHLAKDLKESYIVKEAINGEEGLKMVKKHYPDIVLSDVMMPKMDGFEMCRLIKKDLETCHIPVILLTAKTLEKDRIEGYENAADGYMPKPFVMSVLRARIVNLLDAKRRLRQRFSEIGGVFPSSEVTTNNLDEAFLDKATRTILKNISDIDFKHEHLLQEMNMGRSHFFKKINSLTGNNPSYFVRTIRLRYASDLLLKNSYSIKEVTHMSGFNSTAYFSKTFRELFGISPSEFIAKNNRGKAL